MGHSAPYLCIVSVLLDTECTVTLFPVNENCRMAVGHGMIKIRKQQKGGNTYEKVDGKNKPVEI